MFKRLNRIFSVAIILLFLSGCIAISGGETMEYRVTNIRIFRDTPAWDLARAVNRQNTRRIAQIARDNPELLDFKDPYHDVTLLFWAVGMARYRSAEALLIAGADPNIVTVWGGGSTPLIRASGFSWTDRRANRDPRCTR